ncbi:MAG: HU family DNA-binding protein [Magnetococcales bacterium]|nr:HU family DNA-binding protein [Magnetococcales bacterium]
MNKPELTAHVAKTAGMTHEQATKAIDAIVGTIQDTLAAGNEVALIGFGSFSVTDKPARTGRNPRTGEAIQIAATRLPHFKPGQTLKTAVQK